MTDIESLTLLVEKHEAIIEELRAQLAERDNRIADLTGLLDKYQSVFSRQTHKMELISDGLGGLEGGQMGPALQPRKRGIGISAEPEAAEQIIMHELKRHPKPNDVRKLIKQAILENDFLNHLAQDQLNNMIDCMFSIVHKEGETLIREGEYGDTVFVLFDGTLEVWKDGKKMRELAPCTVFGELAILYNCQRTATVKATSTCQLWAIDRKSFQTILRKKNIQRLRSRITFLKSVPTFQDFPEATLAQMADQLTEARYGPGEYIIRQGARGDNFYIICQGEVKVTMNEKDAMGRIDTSKEARFVRTMGRGEWFGEKALQGENKRTANIIASSQDGAICVTLDQNAYNHLLGDLKALEKRYLDTSLRISADTESELRESHEKARLEFEHLTLSQLVVIGMLGVGGFGRVNLVNISGDEKRSFALKQMKKCHIVETRQQEHVMNEKNIMSICNSDFIVKLWKTFKDRKYVYLLLEACLGGELWTLLRDQFFFTENATIFYVACVIEALDYLHKKNIVYRDLKPENLILDTMGYCKLTDFGFAKRVPSASKTWTFCGTPEYMAPEIVLNKGHDISVDFWSIGILAFELLTGLPPFDTPDAMRTYNLILRGIDAIGFPPKVSKNAQNLIKKLCRDNPTERLGYGKGGIREVEKHVWFEAFDWIGLQNRTLKPPHLRPVNSTSDLRNFDKCPVDKEVPPDEMSGWDANF